MELSTETVTAILSRWIDEQKVHDYCAEYGEPSYSTRGEFIVLGDYWCRCDKGPEGKRLHGLDYHYPRLWRAMEDHCEFEWHDEWTVDYETGKAWRTTADSYSWVPSVVYTEDGDLMTPDHDLAEWIEWATDNDERALLSWVTDDMLESAGFEQYAADMETGWHPGQDADPHKVYEDIRSRGIMRDVVFRITENSQFYSGWDVWVRTTEATVTDGLVDDLNHDGSAECRVDDAVWTLETMPDEMMSAMDDGDWFGRMEWSRDGRPSGMDGNAEIIRRDRESLWWQPLADVKRGTDGFRNLRLQLTRLLEDGYVVVVLTREQECHACKDHPHSHKVSASLGAVDLGATWAEMETTLRDILPGLVAEIGEEL